jgi:hypothetical protein
MTGAKSGLIVVLLAVPFGLYAAWQLRALARGDFFASGNPDAKLPTKDAMAERRAAAERFTEDVRRASAVALQYRVPEPADKTSDPECDAVAGAAAKRSADLIDLQRFLAGGRDPAFGGGMRKLYRSWYDETKSLRLAALEVEKWLNDREPVVSGQTSAEAELKRFEEKLAAYARGGSIFVDRGLVAGWRVRANARILTALANTVRAPYQRVLELPLPLPPAGRNMDVKIALGALAEMKSQTQQLERLAGQAKADGVTLPREAEDTQAAALKAAREWAAADELLALFADPELFTEPEKAATWLPKVQAQYDRTQTDDGRELIRKKVQQFCDASLPRAARLDPEVLIQGKPHPRKDVVVEYDSEAKTQPLSDLPEGLNEFNFATRHKGFDRVVWANGSKFTGAADALRPTPRSIAARNYTQARSQVTAWSAAALERLKKQCEAGVAALQLEERRKHLDELVGAGDGPEWTKANTRIWTRLTALSAAAAKHPALFEAGK